MVFAGSQRLKGMQALGFSLPRPEGDSDLAIAIPTRLQPQLGHSHLTNRWWMACQLGSLVVANVHWSVARQAALPELREAQATMGHQLGSWHHGSRPAVGCVVGWDFSVTLRPSEHGRTGPLVFTKKLAHCWGLPHRVQQDAAHSVLAALDLVAVSTMGVGPPTAAPATWFRPRKAGGPKEAYSQLDYWMVPAVWNHAWSLLREPGRRFSDHLPLTVRVTAATPLARPKLAAWPMTGWQPDSW